MNVHLCFENQDLIIDKEHKPEADARMADLELERIVKAMAQKDEVVEQVCRQVILKPLLDEDGILYRQEVMTDCLKNQDVVGKLYDICIDTDKKHRNSWFRLNSCTLTSIFSNALSLMKIYMDGLLELRKVAEKHGSKFKSRGFCRFFELLRQELTDSYFAQVRQLEAGLSGNGGTLISAEFGNCLQGTGYVYRQKKSALSGMKWAFAPSYSIGEQDDSGAEDLRTRCDRAINESANALAQSAEHLDSFFVQLRRELAFYVGGIHLCCAMENLGLPMCIPEFDGEEKRSAAGLYDMSLALLEQKKVVGNDLPEGEYKLFIITGANQGGKTTFLRAIGQAQLLAQCGLCVGAEKYRTPIRKEILTHFKREEDQSMGSGKLDEELRRLSGLIDRIVPGSMLLFNESFSSTNDREGSEIFRQITKALTENGIEIFSVTHLYPYAVSFLEEEGVLFLRAQHLPDGSRSFRIMPGEPLETAYGEDIYRKVFGAHE